MIKTLMKNIFTPLLTRIKALEYSMGLIADYVVEQGTSGDWTYQKWESGIAECWMKKTERINFDNSLTTGWVWKDYNLIFPTGLFVSIDSFSGYMANANGGFVTSNDVNKSSMNLYLIRVGSASSSQTDLCFEATGKWK